jgi:hypothetical protein
MNDNSNGEWRVIGETRTKNERQHSNDTTQLKRNCPKCGDEIFYTKRNYFLRCNRENRTCIRCVNTGRITSEETKKKLSAVGLGKKRSEKYVEFMRSKMAGNTLGTKNKGRPCSELTKLKSRNTQLGRKYPDRINPMRGKIGKDNPNYGRKASEETKKKIREKVLGKYGFVGVNPNACLFFDYLNNHIGWKGRHAKSLGEKHIVGYSVDYFDEENKVIIEWDEPYHLTKIQIEKDKVRQERILNKLGNGWGFLRWNQKDKKWRDDLYSPNILTNRLKEILNPI